MVQCEMCGTETDSPITAKIEGAELQVCDACADFGTEVATADDSSTSTKYSTSSNETSESSSSVDSGGSTSTRGTARRSKRDLFDEMEVLDDAYPDLIREAREDADLSQEALAGELNEKASLIRKLERGDMQPSDTVQRKIERRLDISLTEGGSGEDAEWENDISPSTTTLGDVVKRGE